MGRVQVEKKFQPTRCLGDPLYSMACYVTFCYAQKRTMKMLHNTTEEKNGGDLGCTGMAD